MNEVIGDCFDLVGSAIAVLLIIYSIFVAYLAIIDDNFRRSK